jgi:hypothetical protein
LATGLIVGRGALLAGLRFAAQQPPAPQGASTPRTSAASDLTGYWVSIVTEDWRWRMVTPPKGDFISIPLSDEGRRVAFAWDPKSDGSCRAFGAAGLMRMPTRLNITWQGDDVLKVESDAGQQTRLLQFAPAAPSGARSLQGFSAAEWEPLGVAGPVRAGGPPPPRALKVVTTNLRAGWLRANGVPYSAQAVVTEHFMRFAVPEAGEWLTVRTVIDDPTYLVQSFMTSTNFKREADGSKWNPTACRE